LAWSGACRERSCCSVRWGGAPPAVCRTRLSRLRTTTQLDEVAPQGTVPIALGAGSHTPALTAGEDGEHDAAGYPGRSLDSSRPCGFADCLRNSRTSSSRNRTAPCGPSLYDLSKPSLAQRLTEFVCTLRIEATCRTVNMVPGNSLSTVRLLSQQTSRQWLRSVLPAYSWPIVPCLYPWLNVLMATAIRTVAGRARSGHALCRFRQQACYCYTSRRRLSRIAVIAANAAPRPSKGASTLALSGG